MFSGFVVSDVFFGGAAYVSFIAGHTAGHTRLTDRDNRQTHPVNEHFVGFLTCVLISFCSLSLAMLSSYALYGHVHSESAITCGPPAVLGSCCAC